MLKKILSVFGIWILLAAFFYGGFSFMHVSLDATEWWAFTRFLYVFSGTFAAVLIWRLYDDEIIP